MPRVGPRTRSAERGQRVYDRWGSYRLLYDLVDRASRSLRRRAVSALDLGGGDTALDLGCGPGASLSLLGEPVGPDGRVLGVDYSEGMARRAAARATHVPGAAVLRADGRSLPLAPDSVDGVLASLALSAMPAAAAVLAEVRRVLEPGGSLAVVDGRPADGLLGRVLDPLYARLVNWQGVDVLELLREAFPNVEVLESFDGGLGVVAVART